MVILILFRKNFILFFYEIADKENIAVNSVFEMVGDDFYLFCIIFISREKLKKIFYIFYENSDLIDW